MGYDLGYAALRQIAQSCVYFSDNFAPIALILQRFAQM